MGEKEQIQKLSHNESLNGEGRTSEKRNKNSGAIGSPALEKTQYLGYNMKEGLKEHSKKQAKEE